LPLTKTATAKFEVFRPLFLNIEVLCNDRPCQLVMVTGFSSSGYSSLLGFFTLEMK
jgi:hypothetical protein